MNMDPTEMGSVSNNNVVVKNETRVLDPEEFRAQGHKMIDFLADYYTSVASYPVMSPVPPGYLRQRLPDSAPADPEPLDTILRDVKDHIVPGLTHWMSPYFFGYFPASSSTAAFLGDMLSSGFNVVGFNWLSSPAATELESIVMDWLAGMLSLPQSFLFSAGGGGVIQGTTCEAILCTLVTARDQMLRSLGREHLDRLVVYASDQTHSALHKAVQIAGIHPRNFRVIGTDKTTSFALSPESFSSAVDSDVELGLVPLFLCATVGTTATASVDPVGPLCDVAKRHGVWVHVDAAYAGSACICPEFRHFLGGVEGASSFSLNAHKWFFTTLDCCCLWIKEPSALIKALSTSPEFLRNKASESCQVVDYKDWQIALSRRFRAMKLWLVIRSHGVANLRSFLRGHVAMAKVLEGLVKGDERFEMVVPRNFSMVCFRVSPKAASDSDSCANELTEKLLQSVNGSGRLFVTHAVVGGVYVIRFAIGATLTEERHVMMAWKVVQEHADAILKINTVTVTVK